MSAILKQLPFGCIWQRRKDTNQRPRGSDNSCTIMQLSESSIIIAVSIEQ